MELSQLESQYNWRRSVFGMREETFEKPWNCNYNGPTDPVLLFHWILSLDLPMLEDETPPPSFYYDLVETQDIELDRSVYSGKLLVTLGSQTVQRGVPRQEFPSPIPWTPEDSQPSTSRGIKPLSAGAAEDKVTSPSANKVQMPEHPMSGEPGPSDDTMSSYSGDTICVLPSPRDGKPPMLVETGTGPDEAHQPMLAEIGTCTDEAYRPEWVEATSGSDAVATEDLGPTANPQSLGFFIKTAILTISVLHTLYVLSKIAFGPFIAYGWETWVAPPPPIEEKPLFFPASIWQLVLDKLAELRSLFA
ncbi:uncharacterized protein LOC108023580 [Drosophila biarmipes]|uniref:uncharacterized protein LOC108023580 n=1 Tax=Drosophila biarmipes TaxID=125945 RepID=UPI0007E75D37|nr:uncharacterized protein LOC108023580 [Drosophila biarmipes]